MSYRNMGAMTIGLLLLAGAAATGCDSQASKDEDGDTTQATAHLSGRPPPRRGGPPPEEALKACENHKQGDACSLTMGDRKMAGTCEAQGDDSQLACRPKPPPGGPPSGGPPPPPPQE